MTKDNVIAKEISGWKRLAEDEGWLNPSITYLKNLPTPPKESIPEHDNFRWDFHAQEFFKDLKKVCWKGKKVLDLGAGRCWTTKELVKQGAECTAIDILDEYGIGLDTAKVYHDMGIKFRTVRGDMNDMPFDNNTFDVVYSYASMHHTSDLKKTLKECYRVLKPGGMLVLSGEPVGTWKNVVGNVIIPNKFRDLYGLNETTPSMKEWNSYLVFAGFKIEVFEKELNIFVKAIKQV